MIVHVSVQVLETQTFDDVETTEQAIERFVADRGFKSLEQLHSRRSHRRRIS